MSNIFVSALIFSLWSVLLFFGKEIGLSMLIFVVPFSYYLIYLIEKNNKKINKNAKILLIPIIILSFTYFLFDNKFFNNINIVAIPVLVSIMIVSLLDKKILIKNFVTKVLEVIFRPLDFIGEALNNLEENIEQKLKLKKQTPKNNKISKIIKGLLITIPLVLIIIILLSTADEIFGRFFISGFRKFIKVIFNIKINGIILRLFFVILVFIYLSSFFYTLTKKYEREEDETIETKAPKDNTTIKIILGALNIIYLVFCFIQIKSLFMKDVNINYAQYARQGFFQLMIVSLINLVTILIAKKKENNDNKGKINYIKIMSILMIIFTFIILVSSAMRMYFYESAFGYTLLRLLVYCILITEAMLLIPTLLYILDKKINLPKIYFIIIVSIYVCMNLANFDNMIAKRNVDRYETTGKIDINYLEQQTGTDAIEQITRILHIQSNEDENKDETQSRVRKYLNEVYDELNQKETDFRDFNMSKNSAKKLIEREIK